MDDVTILEQNGEAGRIRCSAAFADLLAPPTIVSSLEEGTPEVKVGGNSHGPEFDVSPAPSLDFSASAGPLGTAWLKRRSRHAPSRTSVRALLRLHRSNASRGVSLAALFDDSDEGTHAAAPAASGSPSAAAVSPSPPPPTSFLNAQSVRAKDSALYRFGILKEPPPAAPAAPLVASGTAPSSGQFSASGSVGDLSRPPSISFSDDTSSMESALESFFAVLGDNYAI